MKDFVFVSDFDGTLTKRDFYLMMLDKYYGEKANELLTRWKEGKMADFDFLHLVFSSVNRTEEEIMQDILEITFDDYAKNLIKMVKANGGDFIILSAGTSYYIEKLLEHKSIQDVKIFSNKGIYQAGGIHLVSDRNSPYYSERYGIDKGKVVEELKKQYEKVYFAGDSGPDIAPSKLSDVVFAKKGLQQLLKEREIDFVPFTNFKDIEQYMRQKGWLNEVCYS